MKVKFRREMGFLNLQRFRKYLAALSHFPSRLSIVVVYKLYLCFPLHVVVVFSVGCYIFESEKTGHVRFHIQKVSKQIVFRFDAVTYCFYKYFTYLTTTINNIQKSSLGEKSPFKSLRSR